MRRLAFSLSLLLAPAGMAGACGFHGAIEGNWTPLHPKSIGVAVAVREAADRKVVDPALLMPQAAGPLGYLRASQRLRDFGLTLDARPTAVLFVESGLWTRFVKGVPQMHVPGAEADDVVIVTSEAVVAAILERRISVSQAIERGLIVLVEGP